MSLVGVFAFSALLVTLAYAPDLRNGDDGGAQALSKSAVGFAGIAEALRLSGEPVLVNRRSLPAGRRRGLLVVTVTPATTLHEIAGLSFDGPVLAVLPKWLATADPKHRGWVRKVALLDPEELSRGSIAAMAGIERRAGPSEPVLFAGADPLVTGQRFGMGTVEALQSCHAPAWNSVLTDETGATILARDKAGRLYILCDPDLMNSHGIRDVRTLGAALAILRSLRAGDGPVIFDVRLNGLGRERSVLRLLLEPPFLGVTLCLATAAALAGIQAFFRFGPVRPRGRTIPLGKTALVDNTAALVRLAGREHRLGGRYADLTADLAARAVGAPYGLGGDSLAAVLDRLGARRRLPKSFSELESEARVTPNAARLVAAARHLYRWRLQLSAQAVAAEASPERAGA
jgi:hypothetical protein